LEIGFGEGVFLTWAQKKFPQHSFEGWDRDRANVEFVGKLNAHLKLKCADADTEPLENESYDLVLIAGVLQYVKQDFELLLRLNQCLKTGGVIQIYTPIEAHVVFKGIDRLYQKHRNYEKAQGLQRVYRYTEVVELLKNAGFQVIRQVFTYGRVATAAHEWYRFCLQQMGIGRLWAVLALAATWWLVAVLIRLDSGKPPNGLWIEAVKLND
jgi:trans-aconitate methyltransferase